MDPANQTVLVRNVQYVDFHQNPVELKMPFTEGENVFSKYDNTKRIRSEMCHTKYNLSCVTNGSGTKVAKKIFAPLWIANSNY